MRLIDLLTSAIPCHPQDAPVEVHDLDGNRYYPLGCGMMTKHHIIGGRKEEVFVIRVRLVERGKVEQ